MADITWIDDRRKLSEMIPWPRNPRQITHAQAERLVDSVESFGQVETLAIGPDNELYNGHQRLAVLMQQYGDMEVDVRVSSRPLTEAEREKLTVYLHKGAAGEWDFDALSEWDLDVLTDFGGFEPFELGMGDEPPTLDELENEYGDPGERDFWPIIRVQVSPETMEMFVSLMKETKIEDEAKAFAKLISVINIAELLK